TYRAATARERTSRSSTPRHKPNSTLHLRLRKPHRKALPVVIRVPLIPVVQRRNMPRLPNRQIQQRSIPIPQRRIHPLRRPQPRRCLLHRRRSAAHRHRPDSEIFPQHRHAANHRIFRHQEHIPPPSPLLRIRPLHPLPFFHPVRERLQQHLVVIAEPTGRPLPQQPLHHRRRQLAVVNRPAPRRRPLGHSLPQVLISQRRDQWLRPVFVHLPVPRPQHRHRIIKH